MTTPEYLVRLPEFKVAYEAFASRFPENNPIQEADIIAFIEGFRGAYDARQEEVDRYRANLEVAIQDFNDLQAKMATEGRMVEL